MDAVLADIGSHSSQALHSRIAGECTEAKFVLRSISVCDPRLCYCLALAHENMSPYLLRRGETFDDEKWLRLAPQAEFFLLTENENTDRIVGFSSFRSVPECATALHIGDVQIEPEQRNRGAGLSALLGIESIARSRGMTELTLNVFRDNPALRLYERFGFDAVDTRFYKYKMRKTLS
jgi:ribosomal protein S18 acetylase RimI-like enzyme